MAKTRAMALAPAREPAELNLDNPGRPVTHAEMSQVMERLEVMIAQLAPAAQPAEVRPDPEFWTLSAAGERLGVSEQFLWRLMRAGQLAVFRDRRRWMCDINDARIAVRACLVKA